LIPIGVEPEEAAYAFPSGQGSERVPPVGELGAEGSRKTLDSVIAGVVFVRENSGRNGVYITLTGLLIWFTVASRRS
jgi:hypothetical protein